MRKIAFITLFSITVFLYFYKLGIPELRGDEAITYIALVPFFQALFQGHFFPTFLTYSHEPLHLLVQAPFIFFGLSEFWARFPNAFSGVLVFLVLYKINRSVVFLSLYTFSGFFLLFRTGLNIGVFVLALSIFLYYFLRFTTNNQKNDLKRSLVALFVSIFFFIDAIFVLPGVLGYLALYKRNAWKSVEKYFILFVGLFVGGFLVWFLTIFAGSTLSNAFDWRLVAPAKLLLRGTSFSLSAIQANWETFLEYNSPVWVLGSLFLILLSVRNKESGKVWILFAPAFLFFNLVATPTVHLFEFLIPMLLLAVHGAKSLPKFLVVLLLTVMILANVNFIKDYFQKIKMEGLKMKGTYVQKHIPLCEKIPTDLDGFTFRLYFGRGYTQSDKPVYYPTENVDNQLYQFSNLLPYVGHCQK